MTSIEEHKKKIKEHLDEIDDAINEGIEKKPITIGFHCSACSIQFLELYLHIINKLSMGKVIKQPKLLAQELYLGGVWGLQGWGQSLPNLSGVFG